MKFCPTWKLKISLSHFQKVQEHEFLMCCWRDMVQSLPSLHGISNEHNFSTKAPKWVVLFAIFSSWPLISKSCITLHELSSHDHLLIHAFFGGKLQNSKMVHCMDFLPLPLCLKDHFKWLWWRKWYCSRGFTTCTMHFWFFAKHLISINQVNYGLARWLRKHIYTKS